MRKCFQRYMTTYLIIIILVLIAIAFMRTTDVTYIRSDVDQRQYLVQNLPDRKLAADHLAELRIKLEDFIRSLEGDHEGIKLLRSRFSAVLSESRPGSRYTSYTVNKGSSIHMCVRERDEQNRLVDSNTLFFVALHELAHVMTKSIGHTDEFWNNFRYLLRHAIRSGYYTYQPYHHSPKKYCGTYISDTPLKL